MTSTAPGAMTAVLAQNCSTHRAAATSRSTTCEEALRGTLASDSSPRFFRDHPRMGRRSHLQHSSKRDLVEMDPCGQKEGGGTLPTSAEATVGACLSIDDLQTCPLDPWELSGADHTPSTVWTLQVQQCLASRLLHRQAHQTWPMRTQPHHTVPRLRQALKIYPLLSVRHLHQPRRPWHPQKILWRYRSVSWQRRLSAPDSRSSRSGRPRKRSKLRGRSASQRGWQPWAQPKRKSNRHRRPLSSRPRRKRPHPSLRSRPQSHRCQQPTARLLSMA